MTLWNDILNMITNKPHKVYSEIKNKSYHQVPLEEIRKDLSSLYSITYDLPLRKRQAAIDLQTELQKRIVCYQKNNSKEICIADRPDTYMLKK